MGWDPWSRVDDKGLARYVTPEAKRWIALDRSRFDVRGERDERLLIVEAIYNALMEKNIRYAEDEYHPAAALQPIRPPAMILDAPREGTCLDLAAFFCGLCLGNELLPILIVIEGHALAMVSLTHGIRDWDGYRPERALFEAGPLTEPAPLCSLIEKESYLAIECTGFAYSEKLSQLRESSYPESIGRVNGMLPFERATVAGREQLDIPTRPFRFALDIAVAHYAWRIEPYALDTTASVSSLWGISSPRNPFFTGREDVLKHLYDTLNAGKVTALAQPQAISGLGGIGKTQTAIEYAYRHRSDYQVVLWVKADTDEALSSDFVTIARRLNLPQKDERDQDLIIDAVKRWLQNHRDWLLIFDNADDLEMVRNFFPPGGKGHILLTTHTQATGGIAQHIEINELEPEDGALFLLHRAKIIGQDAPLARASTPDRTKAIEISRVMGGLPLALDQAGAFIEGTSGDISEYLDLYQARQAELLKRRGRLNVDHPESVTTTWSLSFEKVQKKNPAAADLLRFCAFLDPDAIPEEIISNGASELSPALKRLAIDPMRLAEAIRDLLAFSLIRRNANKTLTIHRLVQAVLKERMNKNVWHRWAERVVRAVNRAFPDVEYATRLQGQRCLPHAQVCAALIQQWEMTFPEAVQLLMKAGHYLEDNARYLQAEAHYQQALAIREHTFGHEHSEVASSLTSLAGLYKAWGRYAQAESHYQRALTIWEQTLGSDHPDVANSLNNLASLYKVEGKYTQSELFYQRALTIYEQVQGLEHPNVAQGLINLADLYREQGKYALAEAHYQQALEIRERTLGRDHPDVANNLSYLASLYKFQGKYTLAESHYQRALTIQECALSAEHPDVASSLNNLADLYKTQGKYEQAELSYQRGLAIREQAFGHEHPEVATSLDNLALLYQAQGKYCQGQLTFDPFRQFEMNPPAWW